jgi:hypothetical protein
VKVNFNHDFFARYPTHKKLSDAFAAPAAQSDIPGIRELIDADEQNSRSDAYQSPKKRVAELLAHRYCWNPKDCVNGAPDDHGAIHCSLVDSIEGIDVVDDSQFEDQAELRSKYPVRRHGYVVKVAEFGSIKIGELIIKPGERRLNLLRFQFGCPIMGDGTAASVATNGLETVP